MVPTIEQIREIAGEGATELVEEYQDVYMCAFSNVVIVYRKSELSALIRERRYPPGDSPDSGSSWIRCYFQPQRKGRCASHVLQGSGKFEGSQASPHVQRVAVRW